MVEKGPQPGGRERPRTGSRQAPEREPEPAAAPVVTVDEAWPDAIRDAVADTGLPSRTLPAECPFSLDQILDQDYLPEDDA